MSFEVIDMSRKSKTANVGDLVRANKAAHKIKRDDAFVCFPNLGSPNQWTLVVMCDAAYANMDDGVSSVGTHVIFVVANSGCCCVIGWSCNKIKRVVKSTLAAEMLSLTDAIDYAFFLKNIMLELTGLSNDQLPIGVFVDSKSVVEMISWIKWAAGSLVTRCSLMC